MKYFYRNAILPRNKLLLREIDLAADNLRKKLIRLDLGRLDISQYNQRYLGRKLNSILPSLQIYSHLLAWSLAAYSSSLEQFVFVDYGGGSGVLSLLAKELKIGTVIYNDIYDVSCRDAQLIARAVGKEADYYVCGDIDDLIHYLKSLDISVDAISSYDVIEHIYDIEDYFRKLRLLSKKSLSIVFGSGANIHNPKIREQLMKKHRKFEYYTREKTYGYKERDSLKSYLDIRKEIISRFEPSLGDRVVEQIAKDTRGLRKDDIEKCLEEYVSTGSISYKPDHPSNTCDPYTGNWAEHLIETNHIKQLFQAEKFTIKILSGYYGFSNQRLKGIIKYGLNSLISILNSKGLVIAPYYVVYGRYSKIEQHRGCGDFAVPE